MTKDAEMLLGDPKKALRAMAVPMFITLAISQINSFVDSFWCSNLGADALAAVGIVSSLYFLLVGVGNGLGMGLTVAVSKRIGAGEKPMADSLAAQGIVLILLISMAVTPLFLLFGGPIISLVGGGVAFDESVAYAYPYFFSGLIFFAHGLFAGLLRAEGAAKKSMAMMVLSVALNMVLDPLFAFTFGWGIAGLSWATVVSTLIATVPALYWYFLKRSTYVDIRFAGFKFDGTQVREMLRVGVPKMVELNIMSVINLVLVYFLVVCGGAAGVALYNTTWRYVMLLILPSMALGGALVPISAAAFGGRDFQKVRVGYNYSLLISLAITTAATLAVAAFADLFALVFTTAGSAAELREDMAHTIRLFCIFVPFYAWINIASSLLQSIYMADRSLYSTLTRNLVLIAVFWYTSTLDLEAMWWGLILCEIFGGFLMGLLAEHGLRERIASHGQSGPAPAA